jgi:hypothetical protein
MSNAITPKEGEEVLLYLHKGIFVLRKQMLVFISAVILAGLLLTFLYTYPAASVTAAAILFMALVYAFYYFLIWFYDVFIVTNRRVVINSKTRLFGRDFSEFDYHDVTGISYSIKGILGTIFQHGNVQISLGGGQNVELRDLQSPGVVQETLKNLVDVTNNKKYH